MAKATITLPNGTVVQVEGSTAEVRQLLEFYGSSAGKVPAAKENRAVTRRRARRTTEGGDASPATDKSGPDLAAIVNLVKNCEEAENIERHILDRNSQVDRTLFPLYIVHEELQNAHGLTSGEVSKVTTDLGVPVSVANASRTLSGTAAKYVMGDRVRKPGQPVRYKLSRRGLQYMQSVITGKSNEK
jgi:hypothetical protein